MRPALIFAICVTISLLAATPASAGAVCSAGGIATFVADDVAAGCPGGANGPTEVNQLTVTANGAAGVVFTDTQPIDDGDGPGGCTVSGNSATCPDANTYVFDLGASDDRAATGGVLPAFQASTGGDGADRLTGGPLGDNLNGGAGNDVLEGGGGADVLAGGAGNDTLDGGDGDDTVTGGADRDGVAGGAGNDLVSGGAGDDTVSGGEGNDQLDGVVFGCMESGGNDALGGDGGNDLLCGGTGPAADNDALDGGAGEDTAVYAGRATGVNISLDGAANDGSAGEADNVRPDVENVIGSPVADTLTGNDARNTLDGARGGDFLNGGAGDDTLVDTGDDPAADTLDGGPGDDTVAAGLGPDVYAGGEGDDWLTDYAGRVTPVVVTLDGAADDGSAGEGDNVRPDVENVTGGTGDDAITGNAADNELAGGPGADTLAGGDGNDGLEGGAGRDTLDGGAGRDSLAGGAGGDTLKTRDGLTDRAQCGGGTDAVEGEARDDITGDCENLDIAKPSAVGIVRTQVTRAGFVVVRVACPVVERSCAGVIIVKTVRRVARRFIKLGQVNYRVRGGLSKVFRAKIAAKDRRPLRAKRVRVRTVVTNANPETGDSTNATKLATVRTRGL